VGPSLQIGVSISPSSSTCVAPANLPKPLPTANPAGTLFWKRLPLCGKITATPVRMPEPSTSVTMSPFSAQPTIATGAARAAYARGGI